MKVSELAREAGITPSAVRFYERRGILPSAERGTNGYRAYDEVDLCRVRVVACLRRLGLNLADAGRLATLCASGQCEAMTQSLGPLVHAQRETIARTRHDLAVLDRQLGDLERALAGGPTPADLCLKGGDDDAAARLRAGVPVPMPLARLSVLSR